MSFCLCNPDAIILEFPAPPYPLPRKETKSRQEIIDDFFVFLILGMILICVVAFYFTLYLFLDLRNADEPDLRTFRADSNNRPTPKRCKWRGGRPFYD